MEMRAVVVSGGHADSRKSSSSTVTRSPRCRVLGSCRYPMQPHRWRRRLQDSGPWPISWCMRGCPQRQAAGSRGLLARRES